MSAVTVEPPRTGVAAEPVILTPDQRVRVFISSTLQELAEERAAARRAIQRLHLAPVWYESGARPHPPRSMYRAYLEQSQVFVGIYWQRYGWVAPGMDISGLEDEYRLAAGKPKLLYLKRPAPDQEPRMKTFIDGIRDAGAVSYRAFGTPRELERLIADDLAIMLSESFQLAHQDLPRADPAVRPLDAFTGNLPAQVSSFVGRARELERTAAALSGTRMVTLTGVGGVGKTRLALQVARQVAPRFGDGTWLCELASVRDGSCVDDAVAAVFSVTARAGQSTREALVDFLRHKELLLVLDNCEHLLAGAAALAEVLQRSCARLAILATSREGLGIDGERMIPVPSLALPAADDSPEAIMHAEAVRLFADRAAAVRPDFSVTSENAAAVAAVCRRLDGVPMAIELAAARVSAMTPAELARRLDRSFAVLAGARRGAVDRHQTLRAAIDWSFRLLSEPEQALLSRLSVFAGGCTLEAAEKVCGEDGIDPDMVFGLLASLVARSLVVAGEYGSESRYRLLETIRQYGEEQLEAAGQTERWRARHARYYTDLLSGIRDHGRGSRDEVFWAVRLSAEQDNLLAAWSWTIDTGNVDTAFSLLAGFAPAEVWNSHPLLLPGTAVLDLPGATEHPGYPLALAVSAVFASIRADGDGAEELCRRAADANARLDTPDWRVAEAICAARQNIANTRGAFADAARLAEQAARIAWAGGDLADASVELTIAVADHVIVGDMSQALPLATEALTLARQIGAPALIATGLLAVGVAAAVTDPVQARACLRESRELSSALGYHSAIDLVWATAIASLTHDRAGTLQLGRHAVRGLQRGGDRLRMAIILHIIADALAETRPAPAAIIHGAADAYAVAPPNPAGPISPAAQAALDEERVRELRARGAEMDWDQAVAYALAQSSQALDEFPPERSGERLPHPSRSGWAAGEDFPAARSRASSVLSAMPVA